MGVPPEFRLSQKPYVTSVERIASQRARREMLLETLETRFGAAPEELVALLAQINDPNLLKTLQRQAVLVDSLETLEQAVLARL